MPSLYDITQTMQSLNKDGKYKDVLNYFKEHKPNYTIDQIKTNSFVVYNVILALLELGYYEEIFVFLKTYNISSLNSKSFPFLLAKIKDKTTLNWDFVNRFCNLVLPEQLDIECKTKVSKVDEINSWWDEFLSWLGFQKKWIQRKSITNPTEFASARENWYAIKTKALFELEQYDQCFEFSKKALESFDKFHYRNDIWFARRIALSMVKLWKSDEALQELLQIVQKKKDWFIQAEIAELYRSLWNIENSFKYAIEAINNFWDIEFKVNLLLLLWDILRIKGENELAFKHYLLSKLLRQKFEWTVPVNLDKILKEFPNEQLPIAQIGQINSELKKYWDSFRSDADTKEYSGVVDKILNDNENGINWFINYNTSKKVYFNEKFINKFASKIVIGTKLRFKLKTMPDGKEKALILWIIK